MRGRYIEQTIGLTHPCQKSGLLITIFMPNEWGAVHKRGGILSGRSDTCTPWGYMNRRDN
jgi:hypothetical protein